MATATLPAPTRKAALWLASAEGALIDRQIQNTEVLTLKHQIEQRRLEVVGKLTRAADALIHGDQKGALRLINEALTEPLAQQGHLLKDLERVEQQDVKAAGEDTDRFQALKSLDFYQPGGDAR